ncbi:MAG: hypothetical protein N2Z23_04450 [Pyrinomonadaceae bacterium]|nr:hypothetical protein [Pyrinomonadaceae bacterium]MDW8304576.1 hypothetical protein [Acidobacteriota bacterium]
MKLKLLFLFLALISSACLSPKERVTRPTLLKTEDASKEQLIAEIERLSRIGSIRARVDLKFEDNSFAEIGIGEKYRTADGEIVVQRPANIVLKVQLPVVRTDIAQMASNGTRFCVAILNDGGDGRYKRFICGSNDRDYSELAKEVERIENGKVIKKNVNAFVNLRPQHFTEAILVRPISTESIYVQSEIFQEEFDLNAQKQSPLRWVLRGYYILDELQREADNNLRLTRRFWFDRVGGIRLARQQIFDYEGNLESDIVYGREGTLSNYANMPLRIEVTRPKEKYRMSLTYQDPTGVSIGKSYPQSAFELKNNWNLPEIDLDKKLAEFHSGFRGK